MPNTLTLFRWCYGLKYGTFGKITGVPFPCYTVEQPWNSNKEGVSCVPEAVYELVPYTSPKHGGTFCLHNPVAHIFAFDGPAPEDRGYCEIHSANRAAELKGCIAAGSDLGTVQNEWAVLDSAGTTAKLLAYIRDQQIKYLDVRQYRPEFL